MPAEETSELVKAATVHQITQEIAGVLEKYGACIEHDVYSGEYIIKACPGSYVWLADIGRAMEERGNKE